MPNVCGPGLFPIVGLVIQGLPSIAVEQRLRSRRGRSKESFPMGTICESVEAGRSQLTVMSGISTLSKRSVHRMALSVISVLLCEEQPKL